VGSATEAPHASTSNTAAEAPYASTPTTPAELSHIFYS
jgi:hypothetical protein